ncbi:TPA: GNAT family N-acetyltransferase [Stenotrophomonas maltophilia]|nr:GNAT family N-acetyltransferase [Stenotrophomonas maltophilia]HEL4300631.1 GNAT family N-acetyltransferase [Stenotrophomonas maltophilia]
MTPPDPSTTTLQIRDARPGDAATLIALDSVAAHDPRRATQIGQWLAQGHVHVAEQDCVAVGYLVIHHHFFGEAFVEMLMVGPARRGQGIGAALLRHAIARRGGGKLFTSTNSSNSSMQRLLAASGFVDSGIVHGLDEGDAERIYRFAGD